MSVDRQIRLRHEITTALEAGVSRSAVGVVIGAFRGERVEPDELRAALLQYAPPPPPERGEAHHVSSLSRSKEAQVR